MTKELQIVYDLKNKCYEYQDPQGLNFITRYRNGCPHRFLGYHCWPRKFEVPKISCPDFLKGIEVLFSTNYHRCVDNLICTCRPNNSKETNEIPWVNYSTCKDNNDPSKPIMPTGDREMVFAPVLIPEDVLKEEENTDIPIGVKEAVTPQEMDKAYVVAWAVMIIFITLMVLLLFSKVVRVVRSCRQFRDLSYKINMFLFMLFIQFYNYYARCMAYYG